MNDLSVGFLFAIQRSNLAQAVPLSHKLVRDSCSVVLPDPDVLPAVVLSVAVVIVVDRQPQRDVRPKRKCFILEEVF